MRRDDAMRRPVFRRALAWKAKPTVEGVERRLLLATFTVRNTNDDLNPGSLRTEILASNATPGSNVINFDIAASGVQTIALLSALPTITVPVIINGTFESGYAGTPLIELNGAGAGKGSDGLDITAGNTTVEGLTIDAFAGEGINLSVGGNDKIQSNYLGTATSGTTAAGNGLDGVLVQFGCNNNSILNNVISGNLRNGVYLNGLSGGTSSTVTTGNTIAGNLIGLTAGGNRVIGNIGDGIYVQNAPQTTIGGTAGTGTRNIISGNKNGMELFNNSNGTVVEGNYIGTDITGSLALGNTVVGAISGDGIALEGIGSSTIGGTAPGAGNVISGQNSYGIDSFPDATGVGDVIAGNLIGTDATGTAAVGNVRGGIFVWGESGLTIGGTTAAARNVISNSAGDGISMFATAPNLVIEGNYIGTDITGTVAMPNAGAGVNVSINGVTVGGVAAAAGNIIANSGATGTFDHSGVIVTAQNVAVLSNSIYNSAKLGIELQNGANNNQAPPDLSTAVSNNNSSTFTGSLTTTAGTYTLQFFSSPTVNVAGFVEGQNFIGSATVTVTTTGTPQNFTVTLPVGFTPNTFITATATPVVANVPGGTSEFSAAVTGTGIGPNNKPPLITAIGSPTTVAAGQNVTDTFVISNTSGAPDVGVMFYDPVPTGTTFFFGSATTQANGVTTSVAPVVLTGSTVNSSLGTIGPGASVVVTVVLTTGASSVPSFTNTAGVTSLSPTLGVGDDTASVTTSVTPSADVAVSVVGPTTPTPVGQNITYLVTVSNNGPSDALGVNLVNLIPAGTTFVSASSIVGTTTPTEANGTVSDAIGTLTAGSLVEIMVVVSTNGGTAASIADTATVSSATADSDPSNNTSQVISNVIPAADLAITSETATPSSVVAGSTVTFTIDVLNNGLSAATGTLVTDTLPAGLTFVSGTAAGGTVTAANGVITAPIGTLASGVSTVVTIVALTSPAGTFADRAVVSSIDNDPNPGNNTSSASVSVTPITDVAVTLSAPATLNTGNPLTYTATVNNAGPSPATNVTLTDILPAGFTFVSAISSTGVTGIDTNGTVNFALGTLAVNVPVTITLIVTPTLPGTVTNTVTITATEPDTNPINNSASVITTLSVPAPIIEFSSPSYTATETDGTAPILLTRVGDTSGTISVNFSTVAGGNATPGLDFTPQAYTVTFMPGVSQVTVNVPVLADPFDRVNEYVNLQLDTPVNAVLAGGAASSSAVLEIINTDPILVGPTVTDLKLIGPASGITGIEIDTTGSLNPTTASNAANYTILALGGSGKGALAAGTTVPVSIAAYNPITGIVLLIPSSPLPANELFLVDINGTRSGAVTNLAGNPLNSVYGSTAASDYAITVARGTNLNYTDENGTQVNLKVTGPGTLDIDRTVAGQVGRLQVLGATKKTVISGSVQAPSHRTNIGVVLGLGQFGSVVTKLYTPPFYVLNATYPNPLFLSDTPAVDTLLATPATTTTKTKTKTTTKTTTTVKAKPVTPTIANHPHAAVAHAAHARSAR